MAITDKEQLQGIRTTWREDAGISGTDEITDDNIDIRRPHLGHGQREGSYDSMPAMRRLLWRKIKANPMGFPKFVWKSIRMELAARRRRKSQG